jgi:hypothetical protein
MSVLESDRPAAAHETSSALHWLVRLVLVLGFIAGLYRLHQRGIEGALSTSADLRSPFLSAGVWGQGGNPYGRDEILARWRAIHVVGDEDLTANFFHDTPSLYPPPTLALLWPLTTMPWRAVRHLWLALNLTTTFLAWVALVQIARIELVSWRAALLGMLWLFLGPFTICVLLGNPALLTVNMLVLVIYLVGRGAIAPAGILLGLLVCLKPQIAGAMMLYYALSRRWRLVLISMSIFAAVFVVALLQLAVHHVHWSQSLLTNLHDASAIGAFNDPSPANASRWQLVNVQYLFYGIVSNRSLVGVLALSLTAALGLAFIWAWKRNEFQEIEPLTVAVPMIMSLLPVYHRYYDALLLIFPLAWSIASLNSRHWRAGLVVLACSAPFYISWASLIDTWVQSGRIPPRIAQSTWFAIFVLPCQTWALIIIVLTMTYVLSRRAETAAR